MNAIPLVFDELVITKGNKGVSLIKDYDTGIISGIGFTVQDGVYTILEEYNLDDPNTITTTPSNC